MGPSPRRSPRRKRALFLLLLLAVLAFIPIRLNRLKQRLENSMSSAVGRKVTVQNISMRLLPQPGFRLANFSIEDDPRFGAEPVVQAQNVSADLRLISLFRARLEISRLSLDQPSLNLVRDGQGHWNLETVLLRATQLPAAPTTEKRAESRPRFPYIEASNGRINLKIGQEKKVFALTDADFALWLATETEWRMRLAASPVRTDANLGDTGILRVSGSFQRAAELRALPMDLELSLQQAQLGQLTQLIYGRDRGWRGGVRLNVHVSGTPLDSNITADATISDFRRYDIAVDDRVKLQAHCDVQLRRDQGQSPPEVARPRMTAACNFPLGQGTILLHAGSPFASCISTSQPHLEINAGNIPLSAVANLARHMKRGLPDNLAASGAISGTFGRRCAGDQALAEGTFTASAATLRLPSRGGAVNMGSIIAVIGNPAQSDARRARSKIHHNAIAPSTPLLRVLPFKVPLGGAVPATMSAEATRLGYRLQLNGQAEVQRLQNFWAALGLPLPATDSVAPAPAAPASGSTSGSNLAMVDLELSGAWAGFASPVAAGSIRPLHASPAASRAAVQSK